MTVRVPHLDVPFEERQHVLDAGGRHSTGLRVRGQAGH